MPELTPVNLEFEEAAHDLMQRPLTLQLRVTHEVVVDGRTVVEHGARARAPISTSERPSRWNHPGTIVVLVASVPTVDGQDLVLGSIVAQTGRRRDGLGKAFAPWLPGGHATIAAGTRVTSYTSAPLTVRLP